MRTDLAGFFDDRNRERLAAFLLLQLGQSERRGKPGWAAAYDEDVNVDSVASHRLPFLELRRDCRRNLEQITLNAVVCDLEDWRFRVLVDRDDRACALHSDQVLYGS